MYSVAAVHRNDWPSSVTWQKIVMREAAGATSNASRLKALPSSMYLSALGASHPNPILQTSPASVINVASMVNKAGRCPR